MSFEFSLAVDNCNQIKSVCSAIRFASKRGAVLTSASGNRMASRSHSPPAPRE